MTTVQFRSRIEITGINPYVLVDAQRASTLKSGWRKPLPVRVRINGGPKDPWRINLMPIGDGTFYLYLSGEIRTSSNTKVGDAVDIELEFDPQYRTGPADPMPAWFHNALLENQRALHAWDALVPSMQKQILSYFARLKSPEAKTRNLEKAIHVLSGEKGRFMARAWNE